MLANCNSFEVNFKIYGIFLYTMDPTPLDKNALKSLEPKLLGMLENIALDEASDNVHPTFKVGESQLTAEQMADNIRSNTQYAPECREVAYILYLARLGNSKKYNS